MNVTRLSLGVLQRIAEFLADLPEDQLIDLAEGRARLAYLPWGAQEPAPRTAKRTSAAAQPSEATKAIIEKLESLGSRDSANSEVGGLKTAELRALGKVLNIPRYSGMKVGDLRREIVDTTVGRRLDSIATRGFEGLRP